MRWENLVQVPVKYQVVAILYCSYIYDAVRSGFIWSRQEEERAFRYERLASELKFIREMPEHAVDGGEPEVEDPAVKPARRLKRLLQFLRIWPKSKSHWKLDDAPEFPTKDTQEEIGNCPLKKMPKIMRFYQIVSTIYMSYSCVRYACLCLIQFRWVNVDTIYTCYLPGRLAFLLNMAYELPGHSFNIILFHMIYRYIWYFNITRLDLECFMFFLYDEEEVRAKSLCVYDFGPVIGGHWKLGPGDGLFYQRVRISRYRSVFVLKQNRTLEHWRRMREFVKFTFQCCIVVFVILGLGIGSIVFLNILSNEYFDKNYPYCRSFSNSKNDANFAWTYSDPFRLGYLLLDLLDNGVLLIDSCAGICLPIISSVICTQDLHYRVINLRERMAELKSRYRAREYIKNPEFLDSAAYKYKGGLDADVIVLQSEIIDTFSQIRKIDKFVNIFATFCLFVWFHANVCYEIASMVTRQLLAPDRLVQFYQIVGMSLLSYAFIRWSLAHKETVKMYRDICSIMALERDEEGPKTSWLWMLEYYNHQGTRYSLHMCWWLELSTGNYLRFCAWYASFALIVVNLFRLANEGKDFSNYITKI